ncbi:MAG: sodium:calcium antiporter [Thermoleophilia bacterium]|nr:sodium:calcium antiporter [Thermoleophilia bacterium]
MNVFLLIVALFVILAGCELFVNGIEWFGRKLELGEGAVGSVLAAVGTALPETIIPLIAILISGGDAGHEVGIGAILGAPFMLSTLAIFVCGVSVVVFTLTKRRQLQVRYNRKIMKRDLSYFLVAYVIAVAAGIFDIGFFRYILAVVLLASYGIYVWRTMKSEGDLEGECRSLYFHRTAESPHLGRVILQIVVALAAIIFGADLFVDKLANVAAALGVPPLVISLLITPVATELPEKFNSVLWMREKKDTLALGNITGAMVFQSTFPVAVGMVFTDWHLWGEGDWHAAVAAGVALLSGLIMYLQLRFTKRGFGVGSLLFGGILYAAFFAVTLWSIS